jgi:hypothetical protein
MMIIRAHLSPLGVQSAISMFRAVVHHNLLDQQLLQAAEHHHYGAQQKT